MLRRRQDHVLEPAENVRTNHLAFIAAGERNHEHLGCSGHAQVIRPKSHESLDERTLGDDARLERGEGFRPGDLDQSSPRLLARLRWR